MRTKSTFLTFLSLTSVLLVGCSREQEDHIHEFSSTWIHDTESHWHECECGAKDAVINHIYGLDSICSVCGYKQPVDPVEDPYKVTENTWAKNTLGIAPFGLMKNGTILAKNIVNGIESGFMIMKVEDNKFSYATSSVDNPNIYVEHTKDGYFKYTKNFPNNDYLKEPVADLSTTPLIYADLFHSLKFQNFRYDENSKTYKSSVAFLFQGISIKNSEVSFYNNKMNLCNISFDSGSVENIISLQITYDDAKVDIPEIKDTYTVDRTEWNKLMNGEGPFNLINNGSIQYQDQLNGVVNRDFLLNIDGNKIADLNKGKFVYHEFDNGSFNYYYKDDCYDSDAKYHKVTNYDMSRSNPTFVVNIFSTLKFDDFEYDPLSRKYLLKNELEIMEAKFNELSISFLNNKINSLSGSAYLGNQIFTSQVTFNYSYQSVTLPDYTDTVSIEFWSGIGTSFGYYLSNAINNVIDELSDNDVTVNANLLMTGGTTQNHLRMMNSIATNDYPDITTGYGEYITEYVDTGIIRKLDDFVNEYNEENKTSILDDYYSECLFENYQMFAKDEYGISSLSALPFTRSNEVMAYNGVFVDYCETINSDLGKIPTTWQEWEVKGAMYREIFDSLSGKALYGVQDYEGKASNFAVTSYSGDFLDGRQLLIDFSDVEPDRTSVLCWDSTDNMFITLIKQWGAEYTSIDSDESYKEPGERVGQILFASSENKPKVVECMKYFKDLHNSGIISVPSNLYVSYSSTAFLNNRVMFMITSSAGLSHVSNNWKNRLRVAPIPYYDDGLVQRKYVISQGLDFAMTDRNKESQKRFDFMVGLTTGENHADICINTGYYPVTKSAVNSEKYQSFITEATPGDYGFEKIKKTNGWSTKETLEYVYSDGRRVANRECAKMNNNEYMNIANEWMLFVNSPFIGSDIIRTEIVGVFDYLFESTFIVDESFYYELIDRVINSSSIKNCENLVVVE